jgi:hypothetical protein
MARNGKDGWTEEALDVLRAEWPAGTPVEILAERFSRPACAVRRAANRIGLKRSAESIGYNTNPAKATTPEILKLWTDGVPVDAIAVKYAIVPQTVRAMASRYGAKRPAWYTSAVRGRSQQVVA